jgi:ABC-2 type transport system ATP-binding protein
MMLLRTEQLTKDYGSRRALDGLNLEVTPGEIVGLLGPNGAGKSTALRLLLGFLRPSAGRARIAGHDCWAEGALARRHVSYLPGELRLYENMTGRQLVEFLLRLRQQVPSTRIDALADRFDVDLQRPVAQLSSGMKRKLALLQVLLPETPLLLLDEPTNTLDPNMRDELLAQLSQARGRGQAVLFSSHVLAEVERICDRVAILQAGRLVYWQDMTALREARRLCVRLGRAPGPLPDLPGLAVQQQDGGELVLQYSGPLPALLGWLAEQDVRDLRIEPLGLTAVYQRFHVTEPT